MSNGEGNVGSGSFFTCLVGAALLITALVGVSPTPCLAGSGGAIARVVRIEGFWNQGNDSERQAHEVMGELVFSEADGTPSRKFSVTAARAYWDGDTGMHIFRFSSAQPTLNLRGPEKLRARFWTLGSDITITAMGMYAPGDAALILSDVQISDAVPSPPGVFQ